MFLALEGSQQRREDWDEANGEDRTNCARKPSKLHLAEEVLAVQTCMQDVHQKNHDAEHWYHHHSGRKLDGGIQGRDAINGNDLEIEGQ